MANSKKSKDASKTASAASKSTSKAAAKARGASLDAERSAPSYAAAGVDLDHDEGFISDIAEIARSAPQRPEILSKIGGFAGLFKAPDRYENPIFVASADGVGTKLRLAAQLGRFDTVGIDCVAMVVNDIIVQGAEPLVFLDYLAMSKLETKIAKEVLRGIAEGCRRSACSLLGGETATMPGVYAEGEAEIVGFGVGVVERDRIIDGGGVRTGDTILGLAASGFHSNGYSLVRKVVDDAVAAGKIDLLAENERLNTSLASALLAPTRIYVKPILNLLRDFQIHAMAHITGGGFPGNIPRVLPSGVQAVIDPDSWPRLPVMDLIQELGSIDSDEMFRVFNCGIGMVLIVAENEAEDILDRLKGMDERAYRIGRIVRKEANEPALRFGTPDA